MQQTSHTYNEPGLPCPDCSFIIKMTIDDLLYKRAIVCPSCKLELKLDVQHSQKSLELLQDIRNAEKRLNALKNQDL